MVARNFDFLLCAALLALSAGCSNANSTPQGGPSTTLSATISSPTLAGSASAGSMSGIQSPFIGDPNQGGTASHLLLQDLSYGRLVQVFDFDAGSGKRRLIYRDVVIGPAIATDGVDYRLKENLAQQSELTILHKRGSSAFDAALAAAESAREPIADNGLPPLLPPWTRVARNAAISLRFNDLLDSATVTQQTVKLLSGTPPATPFTARLIADRNHGALADPDGDSILTFYPTRVILDLTVSALEAAASNPPLPINGYGLPASVSASAPNVVLRMPTKVVPQIGQNRILRNPTGNGLALVGNGTTDTGVPTLDILRAFRSGGSTAETGDAFNGMLPDAQAPRIVGELAVTFSGAITADADVEGGFIIPSVVFDVATCASQLESGDLIVQGGLTSVVYGVGSQGGGVVTGLKIRTLYSNSGRPGVGAAQAITAFDAGADDADCFITYAPTAATPPNDGVPPQVTATVRFSETLSTDSVNAFYGLTISDTSVSPPGNEDLVAGQVTTTSAGNAARFLPQSPLPHTSGVSETWYVRVGASAAHPIRDLAGLDLAQAIDSAEFRVDASAATVDSGSLVLRFDSDDMLGDDGFSELRGQFSIDTNAQVMNPRALSRFLGSADRSNPIPAAMTALPGGVQTPLVPLGSKLHQLWRHADLGFSLLDEANMNLDVEGLSWAPVGGSVIVDSYDEFAISLAHSAWMPDEEADDMTLFPKYPSSGLKAPFANNFLDAGEQVHDRSLGYQVNPADLYTSGAGTLLMPYPMNQGVPIEDRSYYTWRDTAIQSLGGASGNGVPLDREITILGLGPEKNYAAGRVPTIGLPLLMEFRCYATEGALGLNALDVSLATNSSARPNFRAFSSGGIDSNGNAILVDPDLASVASGGFNPSSTPPGQTTMPAENVAYVGAVDFVTTKSRAHSIWFDTGSNSPLFQQPVFVGELPAGTQVEFAYRGADAILGGFPNQALYIGKDAAGLDPYGDPIDSPATGTPSFFGGVSSWSADLANLDGARFVQVRISFVGNPVTSEVASLSGFALAWTD